MNSISAKSRPSGSTAQRDVKQNAHGSSSARYTNIPYGLIDQEWDRFLTSAALAHHEQSSAYGRCRESFGFGLKRIVVRESGRIVGGVQVIVRPTPIGPVAIVRRGPVAMNDDFAVHSAVVVELESAARAERWASIRVETFEPQERVREVLRSSDFLPSASWREQRITAAMSLNKDDQGLLASMHQKGRYNVRRAERLGVEVRVGDGDAVRAFHELHMATASYQGFPVFPLEYFEYLWRLFGPAGRVQHFLAYHESEPVAAIFNTVVGDHMYYGWGGLDRRQSQGRLMANYLLHYEAMRWARDHGCQRYDLSGVSEFRMAGPTQFKTRIAPEVIPWPETMVRYFGPLRGCHRAIVDMSWHLRPLRRVVLRTARRLGLHPVMPW